MVNNTYWAFIKFGQTDHMLDLFNNGTIYMNTIKYFSEVDKNENRYDHKEGISKLEQVTYLKITNPNTGHEIEFDRDGLHAIYTEKNGIFEGNLYCMYAITSDWLENQNKIDHRNSNFSDGQLSMVVINYPQEFMRRINEKIKELGLQIKFDKVVYYDDSQHNGSVNIFMKSKIFEYQNEFRIFVQNREDKPLKIQIGSLAGIAHIIENPDLENMAIEKVND